MSDHSGLTNTIHARTIKIVLLLTLLMLTHQETFKLITFKTLNVGVFTNENFLETIGPVTEKEFTLTKTISSFPLAAGKFIILVQVKSRGATHILPSINEGSQPQQFSS